MPRQFTSAAMALMLAACAGAGGPVDEPTPPPVAPTSPPQTTPPITPVPASPAPASPAPASPDDTAEIVTVDDIAFQTNSLSIAAGTEVRWVNEDVVGHTVTHGNQGLPADDPLFDEPLPVGATFSYVFEEAGEYSVTCTIHPQMNMTVTAD